MQEIHPQPKWLQKIKGNRKKKAWRSNVYADLVYVQVIGEASLSIWQENTEAYSLVHVFNYSTGQDLSALLLSAQVKGRAKHVDLNTITQEIKQICDK